MQTEAPATCGVTGQFKLRLGTDDEPKNLSAALRELRCHLQGAKIKTYAYASPMWTDEQRSGVLEVFPDARAAELAARGW